MIKLPIYYSVDTLFSIAYLLLNNNVNIVNSNCNKLVFGTDCTVCLKQRISIFKIIFRYFIHTFLEFLLYNAILNG